MTGQPGSPLYYGNMTVPNQETAPNTSASSTENEIFIEDVLKRVEPIKATFYMTFTGSNEWRDKAFSGILEAAGRDHVILSEPQTGKFFLLPNIYVDYIEFDENIQKFLRKEG